MVLENIRETLFCGVVIVNEQCLEWEVLANSRLS